MSLRSDLVKLAHQVPELRPHLLPVLAADKEAMDHPSEKARATYLKKHPKANPADHKVKGKGKEKGTGVKEVDDKLKGMSPAKRKQVLQQALTNLGDKKKKDDKEWDKGKKDRAKGWKSIREDEGADAKLKSMRKKLPPNLQSVIDKALKSGKPAGEVLKTLKGLTK